MAGVKPTPDLAEIVATMQAEYEDLQWALSQMDAAEDPKVRIIWATGPVDGKAKATAWQLRLHWPTIRAALERQAELEGTLREYGQHLPACWKYIHSPNGQTRWDPSQDCSCGWEEKRKALLAEPAAKEGSKRG